MDIIEKVARAICPWDNGKHHKGSPKVYWQGMNEKFKDAYRAQAKAAIAALADGGLDKYALIVATDAAIENTIIGTDLEVGIAAYLNALKEQK